MPTEYRAEAVVDRFREQGNLKGTKILFPRALKAREVLPNALRQMGADIHVVTAYRTVNPDHDYTHVRDLLAQEGIHMVTFTSSSTVENFLAVFKDEHEQLQLWMKRTAVACIGPITAKTAEKAGFSVDLVPAESTIEAFTEAVKQYFKEDSMTHNDKGQYSKKHPSDQKIRPEVADALRKQITDRGISCAAAHKLAGELGTSPSEVGFTIDSLEVKIIKCQLGLFGHSPEKKTVTPAKEISHALEEVIKEKVDNNRLSCQSAWEIADQLEIERMEVSSACEALGVKISPCQLGAF
jgi:hypothetical protein